MLILVALLCAFNAMVIGSDEKLDRQAIEDMVKEHQTVSLEESTNQVTVVACSPNGKYMAAGLDDASIYLIHLPTRKVTKLGKQHGAYIQALAFSPDQKYLISGCLLNKLVGWQVSSGEKIFHSDDHSSPIQAVGFTQDNNFVSASQSEVYDWKWTGAHNEHRQALRVARLPDRLEDIILGYLDSWVMSEALVKQKRIKIAKIENSRLLYTQTNDQNFIIDLNSKKISSCPPHKDTSALASSNNFLALGLEDGTIIVQDTATNQEEVITDGRNSPYTVNTLNFNGDGHYLIAATARKVSVWDVKTRQRVKKVVDPSHFVIASFTFSADGKFLAIGNANAQIHLVPHADTVQGQLKSKK